MSKTFKTCAIFCFTTVWLVIMRIISSYLPVSDNVSDWIFSFCVQIIGLGLVPILLYKFWVKGNVMKGFSVKFKINPLIYLVAIGIGIALHFLITSVSVLWQNIIILMGYTPVNGAGTIYSGPEVLVLDLICTALMPAVCEELTYRGLGMNMLTEVKDEKTTIIIMALLFGLGHQFILQTGYAFAAGLVFAFLAIKTRSIVPGMIIHFINNALSVVSGYSEQNGGWFHSLETAVNGYLYNSWGTILVTLAASAVVVILLLKLAQKLSGNKPNEEEENEEASGTFFYPNTAQYVDDIFGKSLVKQGGKIRREGVAWYEYAFLYASVAVMTAVTMFTFMWGVWR